MSKSNHEHPLFKSVPHFKKSRVKSLAPFSFRQMHSLTKSPQMK